MKKPDSMGGTSRFNPFAESWRKKNKAVHSKNMALDRMKEVRGRIAKAGTYDKQN